MTLQLTGRMIKKLLSFEKLVEQVKSSQSTAINEKRISEDEILNMVVKLLDDAHNLD